MCGIAKQQGSGLRAMNSYSRPTYALMKAYAHEVYRANRLVQGGANRVEVPPSLYWQCSQNVRNVDKKTYKSTKQGKSQKNIYKTTKVGEMQTFYQKP